MISARIIRRVALAVAAVSVGAAALAGCQTQVGAAAFVGDHRISDRDLIDEANAGLDDPDVRAVIDDQLDGDVGRYRRLVLTYLVRHQIVTEAADRLHLSVSDGDVDERRRGFAEQAGGDEQLAGIFTSNGLTDQAGDRLVLDETIRAEIGYNSGATRPTDAVLRGRYDQAIDTYTTLTLGTVGVADQAAGADLAARLDGHPDQFNDLATQFGQPGAVGAPQPVAATDLPVDLLNQLRDAGPGKAVLFNQVSPNDSVTTSTVVVLFDRATVPFEQVRTSLAAELSTAASERASEYLATLGHDLGVRINPRYGTWDYDAGQIADLVDPVFSPATPADSPGTDPAESQR